MVHSYGGYTTNLPLEDLQDGQAWVAYQYDGEDLTPEHGGPARLLVPHLYLWKSAKWVRGIAAAAGGRARVLGDAPATTTTETHGASSGIRATDLAGGDASPDPRRDRHRADTRAAGAGLAWAPCRASMSTSA